MANTNRPRSEKVRNAYKTKKIRGIILEHRNFVIKINVGKFFTS